MSFSNPRLKNPATKFFEFKGDAGNFQYYDKEKEANVVVPLPIYFVVLDELHTVKGYNKLHKAGIFSNEIRNIKEELLSVRVFKADIKLVGLWENIKGEVERIQGGYCKSVYAGLVTPDKPMELVNFQFHGASRAPWFDYRGDKEKFGVSIVDTIDDENGSVKFKRPVFKPVKLRDIDIKQATELDGILQTYLKSYLQRSGDEIVDSGIQTESEKGKDEPDYTEYIKNKVAEKEPKIEDAKVVEETDDLPF